MDMADPSACPRCGAPHPGFRVMNEAVLAISGELSVESVLQRMVDASRDVARARYAALGTPDGEGGFARFLVSGLTDEERDAIGRLPRTHGLLGAMLDEGRPLRLPDIRHDPRFRWWPSAHPIMTSFLGVPIVHRGEAIGAFYLTDRIGQPEFDDADQCMVEMLAAHAAVALERARLQERSRELTVMEERNRLARELHDSVTQTLFSAVYTAEAAATLADRDPVAAAAQIRRLKSLSQDAVREMRDLVFELRPADLEADGLVPTLRKHADVLQRVYGVPIDVTTDGLAELQPAAERAVFRVAQEALTNSLRHSSARSISVTLRAMQGGAVLEVRDDGVGFDPAARDVRSRHLGLTSMEERASSVCGSLRIDASPGSGTVVRLEVPAGRQDKDSERRG